MRESERKRKGAAARPSKPTAPLVLGTATALETNPESIHAEPYHMMNAYTDTVKQYKLPLLMAWREKRQRYVD